MRGLRNRSFTDLAISGMGANLEAPLCVRSRDANFVPPSRDPEMAAAHLEYCEVEGTTDVLTFDMSSEADSAGRPVLDVDIMACIDEAARQGKARGHTREQELLLYIVHGVLHCLGHDDHDEAAAAAMHAEEDRVLGAIGVGTTYAAPERSGGEA